MHELILAIERLYKVFARYPRPTSIVSCPCGCTKPEETAPLLAVGLRELPARDLTNYAFSAMSTQGTLDDFLYFLPRLFEAIVTDLDGICPEILFGKLKYAADRAATKAWSDEEASVIRGYLDALWKTALSGYPIERQLPPFFEIETVLACIARSGEPLNSFLESWTRTQTQPADQLLIQFVTLHGESFSGGRTLNEAFWQDGEVQGRELRTWLLRADTMRRIEGAAHLLLYDGFEHLFAPALEVLRQETTG